MQDLGIGLALAETQGVLCMHRLGVETKCGHKGLIHGKDKTSKYKKTQSTTLITQKYERKKLVKESSHVALDPKVFCVPVLLN